jgi:sugar O-acyltransferase (sialic acid O-acetyltransferase NeuD family)
VVGAGRAAVQVLDALSRRTDQRAVAIVDENRPPGVTMMGAPVLGPVAKAVDLAADGAFDSVLVALGTPDARARVHEHLGAAGVRFANVVDPHAIVSANVRMGAGNFVSAGARLGPCVTLGDGNFVSAMCSLEHHNVVGSYCHFGPSVVTSGSVQIGDRVLFGTGIHVEPDLTIGDECIVASGVTLTRSVPARSAVKTTGAPIVRPR